MHLWKHLAIVASAMILGGCCVLSRSWKIDQEITGNRLPAQSMYHCYTNGCMKTFLYHDWQTGELREGLTEDIVYKYCSNSNGPWQDSEIYPATRYTLNALSFYSYSSAASGDYMLSGYVLIGYPVVLVELPIQVVLDTVLLPWDLIAAPTTPEGYKKIR